MARTTNSYHTFFISIKWTLLKDLNEQGNQVWVIYIIQRLAKAFVFA